MNNVRQYNIGLHLLISGSLAVFLVIFVSCNSNPVGDEVDSITFPDSNLSFIQHIRPIFLEDCAAFGGCHASDNPAANLDLQTDPPTFISDNGPVIVPFRSDLSLLYETLFQPTNLSRQMPPDIPLSETRITAIGKWIDEGAVTSR